MLRILRLQHVYEQIWIHFLQHYYCRRVVFGWHIKHCETDGGMDYMHELPVLFRSEGDYTVLRRIVDGSKKDCVESEHVFYFGVVSLPSCNSTLGQLGCLMHVGFPI